MPDVGTARIRPTRGWVEEHSHADGPNGHKRVATTSTNVPPNIQALEMTNAAEFATKLAGGNATANANSEIQQGSLIVLG